MIFGFAEREVAEDLKQIRRRRPWILPQSGLANEPGSLARATSNGRGFGLAATVPLSNLFLFKTPPSGIQARDFASDTIFKADCTPYFPQSQPGGEIQLQPLLTNDGQQQTQEVYHVFSTENVQGETFVLVAEVYGLLVVVAEDCP